MIVNYQRIYIWINRKSTEAAIRLNTGVPQVLTKVTNREVEILNSALQES
jgi:hypothetical protein